MGSENDPKDIGIKIIGARPGEKMYEELVNDEEVRRTLESDKFFVVEISYSSTVLNSGLFISIKHSGFGFIVGLLKNSFSGLAFLPGRGTK